MFKQFLVFLRTEFYEIRVAPLTELFNAFVTYVNDAISTAQVAVGRIMSEYGLHIVLIEGSVIAAAVEDISSVQAEFLRLCIGYDKVFPRCKVSDASFHCLKIEDLQCS